LEDLGWVDGMGWMIAEGVGGFSINVLEFYDVRKKNYRVQI